MFKNLSKQFKSIKTCKKYYNQETFNHLTETHEFKTQPEKQFFWNISKGSFPKECVDILLAPLRIVFLPEIKYRRILNKAFQPGGWGLMQRGPHVLEDQFLSQEYALFCLGQFVSQSFGEQVFNETQFSHRSIATALEGAKSNALMRCCKDLGIASEMWDPNYIIQWLEKHTVKVWCEHQVTKKKKLLTRRRDRPAFEYPWKEVGFEKERIIKPVFEEDSQDLDSVEPISTHTFNEPAFESPLQEAVVQEPEIVHPKNSIAEAQAKIQQSEDDVNMFESFEFSNPSTPSYDSENKKSETKSSGFNLNGIVYFGKYKGQKWKDVLNQDGVENYLKWLASKSTSPSMTQTVKDALAAYKSNK